MYRALKICDSLTETHPLLCVKKPADRQQHRRSNSSRSKSSHRSSHSRSDSKSRHRADKASRGHDSSRSAADATHKENAAGGSYQKPFTIPSAGDLDRHESLMFKYVVCEVLLKSSKELTLIVRSGNL